MSSLIASSPQFPVAQEARLPTVTVERSRAKELLGIVLQRLWPALAVAAAVAALVLAYLMTRPPTYIATGSLLIEPQRENLAAKTEPVDPGMPPDTSAIDTQVEVLKSPAIAQAVTQRLGLYKDREFNPRLARNPKAGAPTRDQLDQVAANVARHLRVKRVGLTYVVNVGFASRSPVKAAAIANAYMNSYLDRQLDQKVAQIEKADAELGPQVERLRAQSEAAEAAVQQYKIAHNLYSAEGATMAEQEVSTLNQQIAQAKADAAEKQARLDAAMSQIKQGSGGADIGAAVDSETIRDLRKEETQTAEKLAQLQAIFQSDYPEVQKTQAQLDAIRAQIKAQLTRIVSSVRADASAASERAGSLLSSRGAAQGSLAANNEAQVGLVALQQRADAAKQIYEAYLTRADDVASEGSLQQPDAIIDSSATQPLKPASPNLRIDVALAALLGLMSGACAILITELWDRRLRSRADIEGMLGVPFAGVVPHVATGSLLAPRRDSHNLVANNIVAHPYSSFAESFRNLRAFLTFAEHAPHEKTLAVTSALPREGKTVTSMCLARTLAFGDARVVLVDCDLRKRGLSKMTGHNPVGLVEVIKGKASLDEALIQDRASGAWILPAAPASPLPHDLFSGAGADRLFQELGKHFDHIILELPPVLGLADARVLAAKADRVLYLIHWNKTPARTAQSGLDVLRELGANVIGAALTQVNVKQQARYGYCDSSDYFSYFQQYYLAPTEHPGAVQ
jgi:succinoglycan biosynthesis transport protein ExoP